jgi:hypothetical protein
VNGTIAKRTAQAEDINPLLYLPSDLQEPASAFYAFWSDYLKGTFGLVTRLNTWIADEGLTVDEARDAMQKMMRPGEASKLEYAGKVLAALAASVEQVLKDRQAREETARRRVTQATANPEMDKIRKILDERFKVTAEETK